MWFKFWSARIFISDFYQDAETVAQGLSEASSGVIKTGIYHADVQDKEKEALHRRWRKGDVKVVCATIGKGMALL